MGKKKKKATKKKRLYGQDTPFQDKQGFADSQN